MANIKSAKKRVRQIEKRREHNRYYKKSTRTAINNLREMTDKKEAQEYLPKVISKIDGLVKRNIWHQNKANNLKSKLMKHVDSLD
jgi:small subunit ribosomal protein S20